MDHRRAVGSEPHNGIAPIDGFLPTVRWTVSRALCEPPPASNPKLQIPDTLSKSVPCHISENGDSWRSRRLRLRFLVDSASVRYPEARAMPAEGSDACPVLGSLSCKRGFTFPASAFTT